jgi:hypothetical protein
MDLSDFKKYKRKGRSYIPKVCIRKNGQIAFNAAAVQKYDLDTYSGVILYISKDKKRIAIQFSNNKKDPALISIQKRLGNFAFSAVNFLGINDIPWKKTTNFDFIWDEKDKIAIFRPFDSDKVDIVKNKEALKSKGQTLYTVP